MSANRLAQKGAQNMYPRAPLSRRHYLKVAKKSDGGVFFKLHAAPPRTWGGCAAREGGAGGVEVRAPRGVWRTWGALHAQHVADGGGAGTCRGTRGTARSQAAGGAMEAWGGQRGTSVDIAVVCN